LFHLIPLSLIVSLQKLCTAELTRARTAEMAPTLYKIGSPQTCADLWRRKGRKSPESPCRDDAKCVEALLAASSTKPM